ncbi:MAG TPA: hypothetical protein VD968_04395 [Pyrinomonadaceae bacterium]|nr:hypothetical protein [Pyrinomonadaceae bacterium]
MPAREKVREQVRRARRVPGLGRYVTILALAALISLMLCRPEG